MDVADRRNAPIQLSGREQPTSWLPEVLQVTHSSARSCRNTRGSRPGRSKVRICPPIHGAARPSGNDLRDRRVLVVEDDPTVREVACDYLRSVGLIVDQAADGFGALRTAERSRPDLIVLDRMLPGIDGAEVCRRIRDIASTPIVMLTALGSTEERIEGLEAGADDYLVKPSMGVLECGQGRGCRRRCPRAHARGHRGMLHGPHLRT